MYDLNGGLLSTRWGKKREINDISRIITAILGNVTFINLLSFNYLSLLVQSITSTVRDSPENTRTYTSVEKTKSSVFHSLVKHQD